MDVPRAPAALLPLRRAAHRLGVRKADLRTLLYRTGRTTFTRPGGVVEYVKVIDLVALFPDQVRLPGQAPRISVGEAVAVARAFAKPCAGEMEETPCQIL